MSPDTHGLALALETAGHLTWPGLEMESAGGWLLKAAAGYTKRANSASLTGPGPKHPLTREHVRRAGSWYARRQLPAIFRLTSIDPDAGALDRLLDESGYRVDSPSIVLHRAVEPATTAEPLPGGAEILDEPLEVWVATHAAMHGPGAVADPRHLCILRACAAPPSCLVLRLDGELGACGLGASAKDLFGLYDIVTHPERRRCGHARRILAALLHRAAQAGARRAFLQVEEANTPARALYAACGFREAYRYWYRVPDLEEDQ
jgi:GNAT superfamily N-acetyltransferase